MEIKPKYLKGDFLKEIQEITGLKNAVAVTINSDSKTIWTQHG